MWFYVLVFSTMCSCLVGMVRDRLSNGADAAHKHRQSRDIN